MRAEMQVDTAVCEVLTALVTAYRRHDLEQIMSLYAGDADILLVGSTTEEWCVGVQAIRDAYQHDFDGSGRVRMELGPVSVRARAEVAWAAARCRIHTSLSGEPVSLHGRLTAVLERRGDRWLLVQQHVSLPSVI